VAAKARPRPENLRAALPDTFLRLSEPVSPYRRHVDGSGGCNQLTGQVNGCDHLAGYQGGPSMLRAILVAGVMSMPATPADSRTYFGTIGLGESDFLRLSGTFVAMDQNGDGRISGSEVLTSSASFGWGSGGPYTTYSRNSTIVIFGLPVRAVTFEPGQGYVLFEYLRCERSDGRLDEIPVGEEHRCVGQDELYGETTYERLYDLAGASVYLKVPLPTAMAAYLSFMGLFGLAALAGSRGRTQR